MFSRLMVLGAVALGLAGCGGVVTVYDPVHVQGYYDGAFEYAASRGELHTEIVGNPMGMPQHRFDSMVTQMMEGANLGPLVVYTTSQSDKTLKAFKVVMVFNGPLNVSPYDVCADNRKPIKTTSDLETVRVYAVFCQFERPLSEVSGWVSGVKGSDDPKFRSLVRQVTLALFPAYDMFQREPL